MRSPALKPVPHSSRNDLSTPRRHQHSLWHSDREAIPTPCAPPGAEGSARVHGEVAPVWSRTALSENHLLVLAAQREWRHPNSRESSRAGFYAASGLSIPCSVRASLLPKRGADPSDEHPANGGRPVSLTPVRDRR